MRLTLLEILEATGGGEIGGAATGARIDLPALRAEQLQRRVRQVVGDDDLQCDLVAGFGPRVTDSKGK